MENEQNNLEKKRPFVTIPEAIIAFAVILLTVVAFGNVDLTPLPPARSVLDQEVKSFISEIKSIPASQIAADIETNGKPTMMLFYASWCGYCKKLMVNIAALKNAGKIANINLLFLSIDTDKEKLATYLLQYNYDRIFLPYIIEPEEEIILKDIIKGKGGVYRRIIPYSLIFDSKGKIISEIRGTMNKEQLLERLNKAF